MLKRFEISGYKSLQDAEVSFAAFSVIVGRNNVGKSNLFDALRLLSNLSQISAVDAFRPDHHRGDPRESLFSAVNPILRIRCELDLTGNPHPFEKNQVISNPLLQYEIQLNIQKGIEILKETLTGKTQDGVRSRPFIHMEGNNTTIVVNRDGARGGKSRRFNNLVTRSVMTIIDDAELYPHVVALARELSSWRFFHFEPDALREPSPAMDILELESNGRGLSGFYDTLANLEPRRYHYAERALHRGIPEAKEIRVLDTGDRRRLLAVVREDGREFTARVLSDGTLRFMALIALAYAPEPPGLVCFEEPENGVHPGKLPFIVDTLRGLSQRGEEGGKRSQVLVNSHSPYLVDLLEPEEIILATLHPHGRTQFELVKEDLFTRRPELKQILETGEQTLGELWSQGGLNENA